MAQAAIVCPRQVCSCRHQGVKVLELWSSSSNNMSPSGSYLELAGRDSSLIRLIVALYLCTEQWLFDFPRAIKRLPERKAMPPRNAVDNGDAVMSALQMKLDTCDDRPEDQERSSWSHLTRHWWSACMQSWSSCYQRTWSMCLEPSSMWDSVRPAFFYPTENVAGKLHFRGCRVEANRALVQPSPCSSAKLRWCARGTATKTVPT